MRGKVFVRCWSVLWYHVCVRVHFSLLKLTIKFLKPEIVQSNVITRPMCLCVNTANFIITLEDMMPANQANYLNEDNNQFHYECVLITTTSERGSKTKENFRTKGRGSRGTCTS